jgi:hypothetical protein
MNTKIERSQLINQVIDIFNPLAAKRINAEQED